MPYLLILFIPFICLQDSWISFTPLNNHFTMIFPGIPEYKEEKLETELGTVMQTKYSTSLLEKNHTFQFELVEIEYPLDFVIDDSSAVIISQTIREELKQNVDGTILYSHSALNSEVSKEVFLIKYKDSLSLKSNCYWKDNKFFTLTVYTQYENRLDPVCDKFLQSLIIN